MVGKSALLLCLMAGTSAALVQQPIAFAPRSKVALQMSGGADSVPDLKVSVIEKHHISSNTYPD